MVGLYLLYGVYKINEECKINAKLISKLSLTGLILVFINGLIGGGFVVFSGPDGFPEYLSLLHLICGSLALLCFIVAALIVKISISSELENE